jgi:uncharacterized protein YdhG (YjbR/CyaY superfamily)
MSKAQITAHLKKFEKAQRAILNQLRTDILEELPSAVEVIKYGIPTFEIQGVPVLGFYGYKAHNSLFPYSGSTTKYLEKELAKYVQTKGSIHFSLDKPFPKPLLKKIIKVKIAQINASYPNKAGEYLEFYSHGILKSKGKMKQGKMHGYWEWFRKDGTKLRSGSFKVGVQSGLWTTYDQSGKPYKKTNFPS